MELNVWKYILSNCSIISRQDGYICLLELPVSFKHFEVAPGRPAKSRYATVFQKVDGRRSDNGAVLFMTMTLWLQQCRRTVVAWVALPTYSMEFAAGL